MATPPLLVDSSDDTNHAYTSCSDTKVQLSDGIAFASRQSFFFNSLLQLSPCDRRLSNSNSRAALFRPKVDEISLLNITHPLSLRTLLVGIWLHLLVENMLQGPYLLLSQTLPRL